MGYEGKAMLKRVCKAVLLWLLCAVLLAGTALGEGSGALDETVAKTFKRMKTTGGMVLIARDGEIVYEYCYGFADKRANEKVTEETYFKIASVSKLVTALSAMKLVEQGRLDLDENIGAYLGSPAYKAANPYYPKIPLTARHLMSHTSSLKSSGGFSRRKKLSTMLDVSLKKKGNFYDEKPGSVYRYSNYGVGIVGCIIEAITGERLDTAAKELTFAPMGIDAGYHPTRLQHPERIVTTYTPGGGIEIARARRLKETYSDKVDVERDYNEAYGSVWITGRDLCRLGILLCDGGVLEGQRYLQAETVAEMISSQKGKGYVTVDSPYGLNVERVKNLLSGHLFYGHQGLNNGVLCNVYFEPESRFVFTLVTNGCNSSKSDWIGILARSLFGTLWSEYGE